MLAEDGSEGELAYETPRTISGSTVPQFLGQVGCRGRGSGVSVQGKKKGVVVVITQQHECVTKVGT